MSKASVKASKSQPKTQPPQAVAKPSVAGSALSSPLDLAICLGLLIAIFAVYAQVGQFNFVHYDDDLYVYENPNVQSGLTFANIQWALSAVVVSNWMPVTLISHMIDCQLFGLSSGMHHLENVFWHALSTLLLFVLLLRATRSRWPSAFVAFVFALHPLHAESVAWVAERKDVLSTFFCFLALYAYVRYAESPSLRRYLLMALPFGMGLMAKPMLVTFPFLLLLFDVWPLRRLQWPRVLWEKLPLLALSAAVSAVTYFIQGTTGAFIFRVPLTMRIENALNSYIIYLVQMLMPVRLAAIYPFPKAIVTWPAIVAGAGLLAISTLVIFAWRKRPYLAVGWFWYLGTLIPVIGLVQVGFQSHADRYTYIPMIGISLMLAWGAAEAAQKWSWTRPVTGLAAGVFCVACLVLTPAQASYWHDTETLFQHAIAVVPDNWVAHYNLGAYEMIQQGRPADAIPHFEATLRVRPDHVKARELLGSCLITTGKSGKAVPYLESALKAGRAPADTADAEYNLGEALAREGRDAEAIPHFQAALRINPNYTDANNDLGACLLNAGRAAEAIPYLQTAVLMKPNSPDTHFNLALALAKVPARAADALPQYEAALRLKPDNAAIHHSLGLFLVRRGRTQEGVGQLMEAVRLNPDYVNERDLGSVLAGIPGRQAEAIGYLETAQRLHPDPQVAQTLSRLRGAGSRK